MKRIIYILFILLLLFIINYFYFINDTKDNTLNTFTTDGCSLFPDGTFFNKGVWNDCCLEHDKIYWQGGTKEEKIKSDNILEKCVSEKGYPTTGYLMNIGVQIGGTPYLPTNFRWGYGWDKFAGYK